MGVLSDMTGTYSLRLHFRLKWFYSLTYLFEKAFNNPETSSFMAKLKTSFDVYLQKGSSLIKEQCADYILGSAMCMWSPMAWICSLCVGATFQSWVTSDWHVLGWSFWMPAGICSVWSLPMPVSFKILEISSSNIGISETLFTILGPKHLS